MAGSKQDPVVSQDSQDSPAQHHPWTARCKDFRDLKWWSPLAAPTPYVKTSLPLQEIPGTRGAISSHWMKSFIQIYLQSLASRQYLKHTVLYLYAEIDILSFFPFRRPASQNQALIKFLLGNCCLEMHQVITLVDMWSKAMHDTTYCTLTHSMANLDSLLLSLLLTEASISRPFSFFWDNDSKSNYDTYLQTRYSARFRMYTLGIKNKHNARGSRDGD